MKKSRIAVKRGSVTVWIYHTPSGQHDGWTVVHREPTGERKRTYRASFKDANAFAETTATRLAGVQTAASKLTDDEAFCTAEALRILQPTGKRLDQVAREYFDATSRLGAIPLPTAIDFYLKHHKPVHTSPVFSVVVTEFIQAGEQDGWSTRHRDSLEDRLRRLELNLKIPVALLNAQLIDDQLRALQKKHDWSGRTRNHYRAALSNLTSYAKLRGYLPRDWNEMEFVPKATEEDGEIEIYTPEDLEKILNAKPDRDLLPFIALGSWSGPRPTEIQRLDWADLHFDSGEVFISKGKVRTAGHRVAPLLPCCVDRLKAIRKKSGPVTRLIDYSHPLQDFLRSAGVTLIPDGFRHSFISYRRAITKSLPQVSGEVGTDVETLTKRYCRPVKIEVAKAWFEL